MRLMFSSRASACSMEMQTVACSGFSLAWTNYCLQSETDPFCESMGLRVTCRGAPLRNQKFICFSIIEINFLH